MHGCNISTSQGVLSGRQTRMMNKSKITDVLECQTEGILQWGNTEGFCREYYFFPFMNLKWCNSDVERDQGLMTQ